MIKKEFKNYFSLEDFLNLTQNNDAFNTLYEAIDVFLKENEIIKPFKNHETYSTNFGHYWHRYIEDDCSISQKKDMFRTLILKTILIMNGNSNGEQDKKIKQYEILNKKMNEGDFAEFELGELYDFESGQTLNMHIRNWQPVLVKYVENPDTPFKGKYVEVEPQEIQKVLHCTIEFKTGELLITDWFRIDEFNNLVDNEYRFDVNSSKGRLEQSKFYLDNFNFISNTSWSDSLVFKNGDDLVFLESDYDLKLPDDFKHKGKIYKQLRALTIIEKQELINLVKDEKIVNNYLKENNDVLKLKIKPGVYSFQLTSSPDLLKSSDLVKDERLQKFEKLISDDSFSPCLIMQKLSNEPKIAKKKTPKK